ncbi:unnamed protein product [Caenorhabditis nigoni]
MVLMPKHQSKSPKLARVHGLLHAYDAHGWLLPDGPSKIGVGKKAKQPIQVNDVSSSDDSLLAGSLRRPVKRMAVRKTVFLGFCRMVNQQFEEKMKHHRFKRTTSALVMVQSTALMVRLELVKNFTLSLKLFVKLDCRLF